MLHCLVGVVRSEAILVRRNLFVALCEVVQPDWAALTGCWKSPIRGLFNGASRKCDVRLADKIKDLKTCS